MNKYILISVLTFIFAKGFFIGNDEQWNQKVDWEVLHELEEGNSVEILVLLQTQADVSKAYSLQTKEDKGAYVFNTLRNHALRTQKGLVELLLARNVPHRSFFMTNVIAVEADLKLAKLIAERPEVKRLAPDPWAKMDKPRRYPEGAALRQNLAWGVQKIGADQVWEMGYTGEGVVVGGADTGFGWEHTALKTQYQGWNEGSADHNYSWHDAIHAIDSLHKDTLISADLNPCGLDVNFPCDDDGHGTHTMGTMIGDDGAGNQVGVAPGARWIACRNMERGYGKPSTYIECFEWFLAPTNLEDANPDPSRSPHVINNSWGCPPKEGCNETNWEIMESVVNNLRAAGIFVVSSAGNSGSNCGSVDDPAAIFEHSFAVGATRSNDTIVGFSSRGPVLVDGSGRTKPNVVAPGVGIRSSVLSGGYQSWSGTSMAGPHVAGAVALLISANPDLAGDIATIENLLETTAKPITAPQDCGSLGPEAVPNNTYGYGRIDVLEAVIAARNISSLRASPESVQVAVFPNPSAGTWNVKIDGLEGDAEFRVFDQYGRLVLERSWGITDHFNTSFEEVLPSGIYFYQLTQNQNTWGGKIVRQ